MNNLQHLELNQEQAESITGGFYIADLAIL